jgi:hypothetical protein
LVKTVLPIKENFNSIKIRNKKISYRLKLFQAKGLLERTHEELKNSAVRTLLLEPHFQPLYIYAVNVKNIF